MSISISREHEKGVRADEVRLALGESVALLVQWERDDPFPDERWTLYQSIGYVVREEARESAGAFWVPTILDGRTL